MDNLMKIFNADQLNKIFENAKDKLIILMYYTKNNPECRKALSFFEKSALNHNLSFFCVIDMDKFEGESRFIKNINNMPRFDFYYNGNTFGSYLTSNEKEIEQTVRSGEQYAMSQMNMKNNNTNQNIMNQNIMSQNMIGQVPQINAMQIRQQILNNAQMQNPVQFQYLMQNPMFLQQLVQGQIQSMQQQQIMQQPLQQIMQPQIPIATPITGMNTNFATPIAGTGINTNFATPITGTGLNSNFANSNGILPTFQQMQQMFQIFQMMQQMGILNTPPATNVVENNVSETKQTITTDTDNAILLPNGDKLISLSNGKFGLIKKSD